MHGKYILLLLLVLLIFSTHSLAQDTSRQYLQCPAAERLLPTLDKKIFPQATFDIIDTDTSCDLSGLDEASCHAEFTNKPKEYFKHGLEIVHILNGLDLRVSLGGCEAYANTYEFTLAGKQKPLANYKWWLKKAASLIALVEPANLDTSIPLDVVRKSLTQVSTIKSSDIKIEDNILYFEDVNYDNTFGQGYHLEIKQFAQKTIVTVNYFIGL